MRSRQFVRSIFLNSGPRVAGLKRDPEVAATLVNGLRYEKLPATLAPVKALLTDKYAILDDLALQVITHKSFLNGIKPYNEKLAALGHKVLNLYCAKYVTLGPTTNNETAVNGHNLDVLGSPMARELSGKLAAGLFAKSKGLSDGMFWKLANHELSFEALGEMTVAAHMVYALVGAVAVSHGKQVAEQFIAEHMTPALEAITVKIVDDLTAE